MPDAAAVTTAGTFIAAVLEEAGYLAQATFLKDFRDFFREAGALVYILGGIGGVVSMVVFGSFRAARYLLLGPALYWFLIGPTTKYDGVIWQIGGGAPRGLNQARGEAVAREDVNRTLIASGLKPQNAGQIEVATGFALFARPINMLVRGMVDIVLNTEDKDYLMHISKARALESLLTIQPDDPAFINMLESDFVGQCADMVGYGIARSAFDLTNEVVASMGQDAASSAETRRQFFEKEFNKYRDKTRINPGDSARAFLRSNGVDPNSKQAIDCKEMWKLVAAYLQEQAKPMAEKLLTLASGDLGDRQRACQFLMSKIEEGDGTSTECNLENAVALYMLKNAVMDRRPLARFVKRVADSIGEPKAIAEGSKVPLTNNLDPGFLAGARDYAAKMDSSSGNVHAPMTPMDEYTYLVGRGEMYAEQLQNEQQKKRFREEVQSVARISAIGGPMDAGLMEYPRYHLRNLRQQLFTWSMQLPYWQGVLLYLLAVAYPFMALIVLLPGRAAGFLNLPLAWLWVKSWDVGLAFVMVFERVLWNILPSLEVKKLVTQQGLAANELWQNLSEAQKFDHVWNLHTYYICLSMATFAIPVVTGYAALRSKRAVLSSFTDKLLSDAKDAGSRAAGAFGMSVMADRVRVIKEIQGMAYRAASDKGEGLRANGRGESADNWGMMGAITKAASLAPGTVLNQNMIGKTIGSSSQVYGDLVRTRNTVLDAEVKFARENMASFHPLLGRYGKLAMMNEAYAAAMDGSGGFELNMHTISPIDQFAELLITKSDLAYSYAGRMLSANPGLAAAYVEFAKDPQLMSDHLREFAATYKMDDFVAGMNEGMRSNPDFANQRPAAAINTATLLPETASVPPGGDALDIENPTFNTTKRRMEHVLGALSNPIEFQKSYTYHESEMWEGLPRNVQERMRSREIGYAIEMSTKEDTSGMFRDMIDPKSLPPAPDPFLQWEQNNPQHRPANVEVFEPVPQNTQPPSNQRFSQLGPDRTDFQAMDQELDQRFAEHGKRMHAFTEQGREAAEEDEASYKRRLANLNMDWLFGDKDEIEEMQKHGRSGAEPRSSRPLSRPGGSTKGVA